MGEVVLSAMRTVALVALVALFACKREETPRAERAPAAPAAGGDPWNAQPPARDTELTPPTDPLPAPFVWVAEKDGRSMTLLGTLHVGIDAKARLPAWVWKRFDAASVVAVETDFLDPELTKWTVRAPGTSLREELGEEYWAKLVDMLGPPGLATATYSSTAAVATLVSGYGPRAPDTVAMDATLHQRAKQRGQRIVYLEPGKVQSDMITGVYTLDALKALIDHRDELPRINLRFFRAYEGGDADEFYASGRASFGLHVRDEAGVVRVLETLLLVRNRAWIPALEQLGDRAFVAVGALHLVGEGSVLALLGERGYTVRRISGDD